MFIAVVVILSKAINTMGSGLAQRGHYVLLVLGEYYQCALNLAIPVLQWKTWLLLPWGLQCKMT